MDLSASSENDPVDLSDLIEESVYSITALSEYSSLIGEVKLSLSNGCCVCEDVNLVRFGGKYRLYALGKDNYQRIEVEYRQHLLINGEPTVEVDYCSMGANLLLNREGQPCEREFYERLLATMGIALSEKSRSNLKPLFNLSLNIESLTWFNKGARTLADEDTGEQFIELLGVTPKRIYRAIVETYPPLAPYICTGRWQDWLEHEESEIMIDVLETLAKASVIGLPVHDSVIVVTRHEALARQVMVSCYKKRTGFEPYVKCIPACNQ